MHATWSDPVALAGLLPWAAAFPWLLRGSLGRAVEIPFLLLWKSVHTRAVLRHRRVPPWPVLLVWLAAGLAILGAAGPVFVASAEPPGAGVEPLKILDLSARSGVVSQVMIRCNNPPGVRSAPLQIQTDGRTVDCTLPVDALPHCVDVPALGPVVRATIGNDSAQAVRDQGWPAVAVQGDLPSAVTRFAAVYTAQRHPTAGSVEFAPAEGEVSGPAVQMVKGPGARADASPPDVGTTPVVADVRSWPGPADARAALPAGFVPQVRRGGVVLVATKDAPARQVWLNLDWAGWGDSDDAVVLLANAAEWAGGGGEPVYRLERAAVASGEPPKRTEAKATPWAGPICGGGVLLSTAAALSTLRQSST